MESKKSVWKAKNLPRDDLNLVEKIYHVDCLFKSENVAYVLSGFNRALVYDIRAQRKAVQDCQIKMEEEGLLTCFGLLESENVVVGNNFGSIGEFDPRVDFRMVKKYNEHMGAVTGIAVVRHNALEADFLSGDLISVFGSNALRVDSK